MIVNNTQNDDRNKINNKINYSNSSFINIDVEKVEEQPIEEKLNEIQKEIDICVQTGAVSMIEDSVQEVLDEVNVINNNLVVQRSKSTKSSPKSNLVKFAERLTKAIVKTVGDIIEDEIFPKGKR